MKRILAILLAFAMTLTACAPASKKAETAAVSDEQTEAVSAVESDTRSGVDDDDSVAAMEMNEEEDTALASNFTGLDDPNLLQYVEDSVYADLVDEFASEDYIIENVSATYVSKEYLEELSYNSQSNIFFGYTLAELDAQFQGTRYVFTLDDNGQTVVQAFEAYDDTYERALKNVAIGTGVILVCVTVSVATAGTAPAVSMIFAASAKSASVFAASSGASSAIISGTITGIQTQDFNQALKVAALNGSEGVKWGAISGTLAGGAGEAWGLYSATKNGLTMNEVAIIQKESKYPLRIIQQFHSMEEYTVFKDAGLSAEMLLNKLTLIRSDIDLFDVVDEYGRNNYTRMTKGLNPIDKTGKPYQWHHIGQENEATLALLTETEHKSGSLHGFKIKSEIDREAFDKFKPSLNKALADFLVNAK